MSFSDSVELVGKAVDAAGVALMIGGALIATLVAARRTLLRDAQAYRLYRRQLGRSILLGAIVLIRTFLSFSLELEITGRWPWQKPDAAPAATVGG